MLSRPAPFDIRRSEPFGVTAFLLLLVLRVVALQFAESAWLADTQPVLVMLFAGSAYTLALAGCRFAPRKAYALNGAMGLALGAIVVGRVLPGAEYIRSHPVSGTLWMMNVRMLTLLDHLRSESGRLFSGAFPSETMVAPLFGLAAWFAASWLMWSVLRRQLAWSGVVACLSLLVVNDVLAAREPTWSMWIAVGGLLLIARTAYTRKISSWDRSRVDYPELVGQDWVVGAVCIAVAVVSVTGWSTPQWRSSVRSFLESLRPSQPASGLAHQGAIVVGGAPPSAASFAPDLDAIGAAFPAGDATVFYVTTDDPPSGVDGSGMLLAPARQHYWRAAIFDRYTGTGWEPAPIGEAVLQVEDTQRPAARRYALTQHFEVPALGDDRLFAANQAVSATSGVQLRMSLSDRFSSTARGRVADYMVTSWISEATSTELEGAGTDYPAAIREAYLQLPEDVPQRVRNLADRITLGSRSAYDKAERIQLYLRSTYEYRLEQYQPPEGRDAVDYFLFERRSGFCSHYASAMAVMLRIEGVPARVVTGFATGDWEGVLGRYRVPISAAHSWVEVYFPSYGWIEFEPTAARTAFDYAATDQPQPGRPEGAVQGRWEAYDLRRAALAAGVALGLTSVLGLLALIRRRRLWHKLSHRGQLRSLYWGMRDELTVGRGLPSLTPGEYLAAQAVWLGRRPRLQRVAQDMTALFVQAAYSPQPMSPQALGRARRAWRSVWWERIRLRLGHLAGRSEPSIAVQEAG